MDSRSFCLAALLGATAFLLPACTELTPAERTGPFSGANAGEAAAGINRASTASTAGRFATGSNEAAMMVATTNIIAKHQASARQRQVAQQRARATVAKMVERQHRAAAQAPAASKKHTASKRQAVAQNVPPRPKKIPRYIAVETVKDEKTAPDAAKAVVIWDTQAQEIVGNNVYDISTPPPVGSTSRFETYSAEYVGAGL